MNLAGRLILWAVRARLLSLRDGVRRLGDDLADLARKNRWRGITLAHGPLQVDRLTDAQADALRKALDKRAQR